MVAGPPPTIKINGAWVVNLRGAGRPRPANTWRVEHDPNKRNHAFVGGGIPDAPKT